MPTQENLEQSMLRDSTARFMQERYVFSERNTYRAQAEGYSRHNWQSFAEFGWLAAPFSEDDGGLGGGPQEIGIMMEAIGRSLVVEPYLSSIVLCGRLLAHLGTPEQKERYLASLMDGTSTLAFAHAELEGRFDPAFCRAAAQADGNGYLLSGRKSVVLHGGSAATLLVVARTSGAVDAHEGLCLFLVDRDTPGITITDYPTIDGLRAAEVELHDVRVRPEHLLGMLGTAIDAVEFALDHGAAALVCEAASAMKALCDTTLDYLKTRVQFGKPIGANQALQHRMVDMFSLQRESQSMARLALDALSAPNAVERKRGVSAAKSLAGRAGVLIGKEAVQLHGAIGMTDECSVSHYFKRLTVIESLFGNSDWHEQRYMDLPN